MYSMVVPRLWSETIKTHRRQVHEAILDAAVALVAHQGLHAVTMSEVAEKSGVGRATLYKYFPDIESILVAWHDNQVSSHLERLVEVRDRAGSAQERLEAVLGAYALMTFERPHGTELAAFVHRGEHLADAQDKLSAFLIELFVDAGKTGAIRSDIPPAELAAFCLHALAAAGNVTSKAAVQRLVRVTLAGLRLGA